MFAFIPFASDLIPHIIHLVRFYNDMENGLRMELKFSEEGDFPRVRFHVTSQIFPFNGVCSEKHPNAGNTPVKAVSTV